MTWLGQKPESEPTRPTQPQAAANPQYSPTPMPTARIEKTETPTRACLGKSLHVKGELSGSEDLAIEGKVEGTIALNGYSVTIGQSGRVSAEIRAKSVLVGGLVTGNVEAVERVEVGATGTLVGDVRAPRVVLVDGCRFNGRIDMDVKTGGKTESRSEREPALAALLETV